MRTTITLDEDVAQKLREASRKGGQSFKRVVNDTLRAGFAATQKGKKTPPFRLEGRPMGLKPGLSLDNIGELLEQIEGPNHK